MAVERAERIITLVKRPNLTVIPGGHVEIASPAVTTFEQEALTNAGINSLRQVPKQDFIVAMAVLAMDALSFSTDITSKEKRRILGYYLFTAAEGKYAHVSQYMNEGNDREPAVDEGPSEIHKTAKQKIDNLLNPLWESNSLIEGYNEFARFIWLVDRVMPSFRYDAKKRKIVTNEVAMLLEEGLSIREVLKFFDLFGKVLPRNAWGIEREGVVREVLQQAQEELAEEGIIADRKGIRERALKLSSNALDEAEKTKVEEEKFFSTHPEAYKVLELMQQKLSHRQIATEMKRPISEINKLTRALIFLGKAKPFRAKEEKMYEHNAFLRELIVLRNKYKLNNLESAKRLEVSYRSVLDGAKFLIWMGLVKPLRQKDVWKNRTITALYEKKLTNYLNSLPLDELINLTSAHRDFCAKYASDMGLESFIELYLQIAAKKPVPPYRMNFEDKVRERMTGMIQKMRSEGDNSRLSIKQLSADLNISSSVAKRVFATIENPGPSNTRKSIAERKLEFIEVIRETALAGGVFNALEVCKRIGIGKNLGLRIYHSLEGKMPLPPLKTDQVRMIKEKVRSALDHEMALGNDVVSSTDLISRYSLELSTEYFYRYYISISKEQSVPMLARSTSGRNHVIPRAIPA